MDLEGKPIVGNGAYVLSGRKINLEIGFGYRE
jgi:hypothetical protein